MCPGVSQPTKCRIDDVVYYVFGQLDMCIWWMLCSLWKPPYVCVWHGLHRPDCRYAAEQLRRMREGRPQPDFWMKTADEARETPPLKFLDDAKPSGLVMNLLQ